MDQLLPRPATPGEALLIQQNNMLFQENYVRSQNEQALYAAWKQAVEENNTLNTLLKTQIQDLRSEVANLKGENEQVRKPEPEPIEYIILMKKNLQKRQSGSYNARETPKRGKWILHPPPQPSQSRSSNYSSPAVKRLNQ